MESDFYFAICMAWGDITQGEVVPGIERYVDPKPSQTTEWSDSSPIDQHWVPLFTNSEEWFALASDIGRDLVTHPRAPVDEVSVDITNWDTWTHAAYNSAIELAMSLVHSVCDACRHEFHDYQQQNIDSEQLIAALNAALPKIPDQDAVRIDSRMNREWVLWNESSGAQQSKVILPTDENVSAVYNLLQKSDGELGVTEACNIIAEKRGIKSNSLRTSYYRWEKKSGL